MDCIDLRPWARKNRYRWRYEESYRAEKPENRGDGRWYVEIVCRNGLIYPSGGSDLLAYAKAGVRKEIEKMPDTRHHQWDGNAEVFRFPFTLVDQVAHILRPKRLPGRATLTSEQRAILKSHAFRGGQKT
jgi:hypothetical protein